MIKYVLFLLAFEFTNLMSMELMSVSEVLALYSRTEIKPEPDTDQEIEFFGPTSFAPTISPIFKEYGQNKQSMKNKPFCPAILEAYIGRFFISKITRKKKHQDVSDWLSSALELLSEPQDNEPQNPLVYSFSATTGKMRYARIYKYKPKRIPNPNQIEKGAKIQKSLEKKISKEQAQQWPYFKNKRKSHKQ